MESTDVADSIKKELQATYYKLNPAKLKRQITDLQNKLGHLGTRKTRSMKRAMGC